MQVDRILGDRVLIRLLGPTKATKSGIVLPDRAASLQPRYGVIVSVGNLLTPNGDYRMCLRVDVGEIVLLPPKGGFEIDSVDGGSLWVFSSDDVLAVVKE